MNGVNSEKKGVIIMILQTGMRTDIPAFTPLTRTQPVSARMTQPVLRPVIFSWKNIAVRARDP